MNVSERYESAGLKFKLQLRMNWGNVEWSTEQFARDRNRKKLLKIITKLKAAEWRVQLRLAGTELRRCLN